jgi:hypothetical protein
LIKKFSNKKMTLFFYLTEDRLTLTALGGRLPDEVVKPFFSRRVRTGSVVENCFKVVNCIGATVILCTGVCRLVILTNARESSSLTSGAGDSVSSFSYLNKN